MPTPNISDVHISRPLSNISIQMIQESEDFIATKVFPAVPVKHKADTFVTYDRAARNTQAMEVRAPGTETVGGGWNYGEDTYLCKVYGYHVDIDDQTRDNADEAYDLEAEAAEDCGHKALLQREDSFMSSFFAASTWGREFQGEDAAPGAVGGDTAATTTRGLISRFSQFNRADSAPFVFFKRVMREQKLRSGYTPNTLIMSQDIFDVLAEHPDYLERVTGGSTNYSGTELQLNQLAGIIGVNRVLLANAVEWVGDETTEAHTSNNAFNAANGNAYMGNQNAMLFLFVKPGKMGLKSISAGCVFEWTGYRGSVSNGAKVKKFRMESIESDRIEISLAYDMKVLAKDCGTWVFDCIAD